MKHDEIGDLAENIALNEEILSVPVNLRNRVRRVSNDYSKGYDLESVDTSHGQNSIKVIEVKSWNKNGFFYVSLNEIKTLEAMGDHAWIYLVDVSKSKIVKKIQNPFKQTNLRIEPIEFRYFY